MYAVLIWSDLEGDFILWRKDGAVVKFDTEDDAITKATELKRITGEQTRIQYLRTLPKRGPKPRYKRASRIQRIQTVMLGNERLRIIGIVQGDKVLKASRTR